MTKANDAASAPGEPTKRLSPLAATVIAIAAIVLVLVCLFPFAWMALSSIKKLAELFTVPPHWLPSDPTLANYGTVFFTSNIPRYFLNSCIIAAGATIVALALAIFAAYGFARFEFPGKPILQSFVLVGQLLPTAAIIVPLFITLRWMHLINTYWGLIWMLTSYMRGIPTELEEAAVIDGASRLGVLFRITLPLAVPGVVAVAVFSFVTCWNEYVFALVFAQDQTVKTLPIGLTEFSTEFNTDWGGIMAASMVMTVPVVLLFLAFQKLFVGGLTAGATKG